MAHILRHRPGGRHVAAQGGQGLGEGTHIHIHLILQPKEACGAAAAIAQHTQAVGIVHHDTGAVLLGQGADFREPCNVAAHGEHAVGNDKGTVLLRHTGKLLFQILHIAVAVAQHLSVAHLAAGIDGGVVLPVADHIVVPAHQGTDDAHIGLKACAKGDDCLLM